MKASIENQARILFVIVVAVAVGGAAAWYFLKSTQYETFQLRTQDPVSGLIVDAPVEFHGVEVGKVKRIELTDPHTVSILVSVRKDAPVTKATVATITGRGLATRGFTGYVYVALENVGADTAPVARPVGSLYANLPTAPSRSVSLDTAISQLDKNVQSMTDLVQSVLDPTTVASLKQSVESLQHVAQTLAANNEKLASTISNAERASAHLQPLLRSTDDTIRALRTEVLPEAQRTFANLDHLSTGQLKPLLQSSNDTLKALQTQVLPEAYRTLAKLDDLSTSLGDLTAKIQSDPSVLVRGSKSARAPGETR